MMKPTGPSVQSLPNKPAFVEESKSWVREVVHRKKPVKLSALTPKIIRFVQGLVPALEDNLKGPEGVTVKSHVKLTVKIIRKSVAV